MTNNMAVMLIGVNIINAGGNWFRAKSNGQRVTLAALYRAGYLIRRVWRKGRNPADNAHEYANPIYIERGVIEP